MSHLSFDDVSLSSFHLTALSAINSERQAKYYNELVMLIWNHFRSLIVATLVVFNFGGHLSIAQADDEAFGPTNLLQTLKTPFGSATPQDKEHGTGEEISLEPIAINQSSLASRLGIKARLNAPSLFLPDRLIMGKSSEFSVKGPPGAYAAIAMADKNSGAKPIYGQKLRLGPDRKVVAVGQIPPSGVLVLSIETPIQGDMVDSSFFFEAAIWSQSDFSDLQMAQTVAVQKYGPDENGAIVTEEVERKKEHLFTLDTARILTGASNPNNGASQNYGSVHPSARP